MMKEKERVPGDCGGKAFEAILVVVSWTSNSSDLPLKHVWGQWCAGEGIVFNFKAHEHFGKLIFVKYAVDLVLAWKLYHTWFITRVYPGFCAAFNHYTAFPNKFTNWKIHLRNNGTPLKLPIESFFFFLRNAKPLGYMCKTSKWPVFV